MIAQASFVLFPLGKERFALPSGRVAELASPGRLYTFPHTTPRVTGVLVRRGRIVPVLEVADVLAESDASARRFYLIADRNLGAAAEWTAIPVTGECELVAAEMQPRTANLPAYVLGQLALGPEPELVRVLDFDKLLAAVQEPGAATAPAMPKQGKEAQL